MRGRTQLVLVTLVAVSAIGWAAQSATHSQTPGGGEYLYVENTFGGDITVIDIPGHKVVSTIPAAKVGHHPDDVTLSPNGEVLYVNRLDTRDLLAISTATEEVLWILKLGGIPHHTAISGDGRRLYVPIYNENFTEVVDTQKREVTARIPTGFGGHSLVLSDDGTRGYVGSILHDRISVFDTATNKVLNRIPFPEGVRPFVVSRDQKRVYAQLSKMHGFVVADLETGRIGQTVHLPPLGKEIPAEYPHTVNHGLTFTPDRKYLVAAASLSDYVAILSYPDMSVVATVPVGKEPGWVSCNRDGRFCYSSNRVEDTVSVISMQERKEIARIKVGDFPQRMETAVVPNRRVQTSAP
jgi:DNA-binding beta-propeller fold protein YncE